VRISQNRGDLRGSSGSGPVIYAEPGDTRRGRNETGDLRDVQVERGATRITDARRDSERVLERQRVTASNSEREATAARSARDLRVMRSDSLEYRTPGALNIRKAGGAVDLAEALYGASIVTGGGNVTVGRGRRTVEALTGGGDIRLGPIAGSVRAGTGGGDIEVTIENTDGERQTIEMTSGTGKMTLVLPADFDGRFEVETAYTRSLGRATRIDSDFDLQRESPTDWDDREGTPRRYVRAHGTAGRGRGLVTIKTVNGDIDIRRGR
jgi:hypothetical protein